MPGDLTPTTGSLPAMPERAVQRPNEEPAGRSSEESERRRLLRASYQSTNTAAVPSILERPSEEISDRGSLSRQQVTHWQAPSVLVEEPGRISQDMRPPGPGMNGNGGGRSTSNDYTVYDGVGGGAGTPTPANFGDAYNPNNALQFRGADDNYFQRPYRRAGPPSVRDTTETASIRASRYTPVPNGYVPRKSASITPARPHWPDGYDNSLEPEDDTPQKPPPPRPIARRGTSIYLVREGGDSDDSPPPGDFLQLPIMNWLRGPVRNRKLATHAITQMALVVHTD